MLIIFKKIAVKLIWLLAITIILTAIGLNVMRFILPYWRAPRQYLQTWASSTLHLPIKIAKVDAYWRGVHPVLEFENVQLLGRHKQRAIAQIHYLQIKIDLWESILHRSILPGNIVINGSRFSLRQDKTGHLLVVGLNKTVVKKSYTSPEVDDGLQDMLSWLLSQVNLTVRGVDFKIHLYNKKIIYVRKFNLDANRNRANQIQGEVQLVQPQISNLSFVYQPNEDQSQNHFAGRLYLKVNNLRLQAWYPLFTGKKPAAIKAYSLKKATWNGDIWLDWAQQLQSLQVVGKLNNVLITHPVDKKVFNLQNISGNVYWQREKKNWRLSVGDLNVDTDKVDLGGFTAALQHQSMPLNRYTVKVIKFDFSQLQQLYKSSLRSLLPQKFWQQQKAFKPQGIVKQLTMVWHSEPKPKPNLPSSPKVKSLSNKEKSSSPADVRHFFKNIEQINLQAVNLGWREHDNIPGMKGLNGDCVYTPKHAHLLISSAHDSTLFANKLFKHSLPVDYLSGQIDWTKKPGSWDLNWKNLNLKSNSLQLTGSGKITKQGNAAANIQTQAKFSLKDISQLREFIPQNLLHSGLQHWLANAFKSGSIASGVLDWRGAVNHFPEIGSAQNHFKVQANLSNTQFHFANNWPDVNDMQSRVIFNGKKMLVDMHKGAISKAKITSLHASIDDLTHPDLKIKGNVKGDLRQGRDFIIHTPLSFAAGLKSMQIKGLMNLNLDLDIPIHSHKPPIVNGGFDTYAAQLSLPKWHVVATNVAGKFRIKNNKLFAKNIHANLLGHPAVLQVATAESMLSASSLKNAKKQAKSTYLTIDIKGRANVAQALKGRNLFFSRFMKGDFPYDAKMIVYPKKNWRHSVLTITSNGSGLAIDMPQPFAKNKLHSMAMRSMLTLAKDDSEASLLRIYASDKWSVALNLLQGKDGVSLGRGSIRLNSANAVLPSRPGLVVSGSLYSLDWSKWQNYLPGMNKTDVAVANTSNIKPKGSKDSAASALKVRLVNLQLGRLRYNNYLFKNAGIKLWFFHNKYRLHIDSEKINGYINIPKNYPAGVVVFKLARLRLPLSVSSADADKASPAKKKGGWLSNPNALPALHGSIADFKFKKHDFGDTVVDIEHVAHGLNIKKLNTGAANFSLRMRGNWLQQNKKTISYMHGSLSTKDAGATAKEWGVVKTLSGGKGYFDFDLRWPGAILPPVLSKANGYFSMNIDHGRIVDLDKETQNKMGLGKLLNLLSMQTLPRRLMLDFSDLTKNGYSFDVMKGDFKFKNGRATTNNGYLDGPVANVNLNGSIDFAKNYYDMTADVRPHLTSSLPLIATIAGTPIAGVITWVLNKAVVGPIVGRIARKVIHMEGYLNKVDKPKVTIKAYHTK